MTEQKRVGRYAMTELIGQGGMAEVWHAVLTGIGGFEREVAVKLLLPQFGMNKEFVDMLLDEARIAGSIVHSNVVQVLDVGQDGDRFYLVMEYVPGTDLRGLIKRSSDGRIPLEHALFVISEVAKGLEAVHSARVRGMPRRIVHRDISPSNILISRSGEVKLADFGIAHAAQRLTQTRVGSVKGKARYMSPEQLSGMRLDGRSDLYSLAVVLAEVLIGPSVFPVRGDAPGRARILAEAERAHLPQAVVALLAETLDPKMDGRPPDAEHFGLACTHILHSRQSGYDERRLARFAASGGVASEVDAPPTAVSAPPKGEDPTRPALHVGSSDSDPEGRRRRRDERRLAPGTELFPVRKIES